MGVIVGGIGVAVAGRDAAVLVIGGEVEVGIPGVIAISLFEQLTRIVNTHVMITFRFIRINMISFLSCHPGIRESAVGMCCLQDGFC
jgi:hypothetical protein